MKVALALLTLTLLACTGGVDTRVEVAPSKLWGNYRGTYTYEFYDEEGNLVEEKTGDATCVVEEDGDYEIEWFINFSDVIHGFHEIDGTKLMKNGGNTGSYFAPNPGASFNTHESNFFRDGNNLEVSSTGKSVSDNRRWYATFQLKTP